MSRRDWWLWLAVAGTIVVLHAAIPACVPRYEYMVLGPENADVLRIDRWTGENDHMWIVDRGPGSLTAPGPLR